jgi:hypothetical protein
MVESDFQPGRGSRHLPSCSPLIDIQLAPVSQGQQADGLPSKCHRKHLGLIAAPCEHDGFADGYLTPLTGLGRCWCLSYKVTHRRNLSPEGGGSRAGARSARQSRVGPRLQVGCSISLSERSAAYADRVYSYLNASGFLSQASFQPPPFASVFWLIREVWVWNCFSRSSETDSKSPTGSAIL